MPEKDLVQIKWIDSNIASLGWAGGKVVNEVTRCCSVGWIVAKSKMALSLTSTVGGGEEPQQRCGTITIPRCAITKITRLKKNGKSKT